MAKLRLPRHILPFFAIGALGFAAYSVATTQPDRQTTQPSNTPPTAPATERATVSGAGIVEPSSELIEVGASRAGIITNLAVQPGQLVSRGDLLFTIDPRDAQAALGEREAAVGLAQQQIAQARTDLASADRLYRLYANVNDPRAVAEQQVIERRNARDQAAARLAVAQGQLRQAQAQVASARTTLGLLQVRAPATATVLQVNTRVGQFATAGPGPGNQDPLIVLGQTNPLHVRIDIDENEIERVEAGATAFVSPRGNAGRRVQASFVRAEPLVRPKRSLTNSAQERVDVRVLQLIYALPAEAGGFFVGQQVDAYIPARRAPAQAPAPAQGAQK
ncbi:MAG TPA: HlyD family efflux transporter periplasmic adaptor subunit [Allosphingosinicella sp.]|jgi:multidrug resistance efflux pump|nr:HlyD family efflux transporter periplasmic adaptor subunit [Allosphingosinicella sp.]